MTLLDIVLWHGYNVQKVFSVAYENNLSLTSEDIPKTITIDGNKINGYIPYIYSDIIPYNIYGDIINYNVFFIQGFYKRSLFLTERQSLFDIALMLYGNAASAFELAKLNNISANTDATYIQKLSAINISYVLRKIVKCYEQNKINIATNDVYQQLLLKTATYVQNNYVNNDYVIEKEVFLN